MDPGKGFGLKPAVLAAEQDGHLKRFRRALGGAHQCDLTAGDLRGRLRLVPQTRSPSHPAPGLQLLTLASLARKLGGFAVPGED